MSALWLMYYHNKENTNTKQGLFKSAPTYTMI